ncbi:MAG: rhodanese-like domain-containing protein [Gracilimonas sp.]|uniref:rhodanese-like domain-containing protein n=1 Tax=Gracilimonas TaxID=649462 RepID=UPI001B12218C|nr:rhodanese-like domain-containing protein [Gracilimonas sp.]MBO6585721.1 rhodanese-like domain-containing protein [Gracilimonas sp.]MBO6616718.1 rhodanese-like domain-containing protein [Gracilimonas sp.]
MKTVITVLAVVALAVVLFISFNSKKAGPDNSTLQPESFKQKHQETPGVVIDVRTKDEFNSGHLALADHNFDLLNGDFQSKLDSLDKNETYYLYCRSGNRSGQATRLMKENGFEKVYNIGGFSTLANSGLEVN